MARSKSRPVVLSAADRGMLGGLLREGSHSAQQVRRARILLELDENAPEREGPVPFQDVVAQRAGVCVDTVVKVSRAYAECGGVAADVIARKKRPAPPVEPKLTGDVEARLIALACSSPPQGAARWSLRLLEKHVALTDGMPALDHTTIGRALRKRNFVLI